MKKLILLSIILIVGCDELTLNNNKISDGTAVTDTLYISYDTTITVMDTVFIETESNLIEREFVIIKHLNTGLGLAMATLIVSSSCTTDNPADCAGECGGDAVEQTYYYDNDGDGLGNNEISYVFCSAWVDEDSDWVLNSDDDDDTKAICDIFYTFNIADSLETTDGNISFTYNEEDYLIDVSSCIEIDSEKITRLIQDIELKVVYVFEEQGWGYLFNYSSPNELLYVK